MTIRHHPEDALLLDHAAGTLDEAIALVVAVHLAACGECCGRIAYFEAAGGALLDAAEPTAMSDGALDAVFSRIARMEADDREEAAQGHEMRDPVPLPEVLRAYLPAPFARLPWKRFGAIETVALPVGRRPHRARLVRMASGREMHRHMHAGNEYVAVVSGGFADRGEKYGPGDFCVAGPADDHSPLADPGEPCIALVVHDAPMRFSGPLLRLLNPLLR